MYGHARYVPNHGYDAVTRTNRPSPIALHMVHTLHDPEEFRIKPRVGAVADTTTFARTFTGTFAYSVTLSSGGFSAIGEFLLSSGRST